MENISKSMQSQTTDEKEAIFSIALTQMNHFSLAILHELHERVGSATAIVENRRNIRDLLPDATDRLVDAFSNMDDALRKAEAEYEWDVNNKIEVIPMNDSRYPQRMLDCPDAPLVLFFRGNANLNAAKTVAMIGTRHSTNYGHDIISNFMGDLRRLCPEVLIVSGLAYGVDIHAHREALQNGYPTVGVLAHGLDQIYPTSHRKTAIEMMENGGLLTEYTRQTTPVKGNFVQRNRIVAGICDATIIVESAVKGGGLITINIAHSYHRDCFAFPGAVNAEYSKGCNNLLRENKAALITCAEDFVAAMGWMSDNELEKARKEGIERQMFPDLSDEERRIVDTLAQTNDLQINMLAAKTLIPINRLSTMLFYLEMKGVLRTQAGGIYHLM